MDLPDQEGVSSMGTLTILGIILIAYGAIMIALAIFKPAPIWRMGKVQAFVKLLGEKGTVIFSIIMALIVLGIGIALVLL